MATAPATAPADAGPRAARPGLTLLATGLGLFMIFLDATIVNVALPDIQTEFGVGESGVQWVVAAYSLTMGMFMMSSASFADRRGRRTAYLAGMGLFAVASIGCGLAPSILVLNLARGLQGVGAAVVNVASLALVGAAFTDPSAKAKAIGSWTGIAAVGLAIGPTLGGVLTESLGWRSIFLVNPVIAAAAAVVTVAFVRESRDPVQHRFDVPGQLLFIASIGMITYALIQGPQAGWLSPLILGLLLGGLALLGVFALAELRSPDPMMDVRVFGDKVYTVAIITIFAVLFCIYGTMLVVTQYFQNVRGYSPEEAGFLMLAMTVPTVVAAPLSGRLVARYGGRLPTLIGVGSITVGMAILALTTGGPLVFTMIGLACAGVAGGLAVSPATSVAMSSIDPARSGMASGILSAQRALGSTTGFAVMGSVMAAVVALLLPNAFAPYLPDQAQRNEVVAVVVSGANPQALAAVLGPGKPLPATVTESDDLLAAADSAFVSGMRAAWAVAFVVILGALIAGWIVIPHGHRRLVDDELEEAGDLDAEEDCVTG